MRSTHLLTMVLVGGFLLSADVVFAQRGGFGRGPGGGQGNGMRNGQGRGLGPAAMARQPTTLLQSLPVMKALDTDGNGELSPNEIASATAALKTLDQDADGTLTASELMPDLRGMGPGIGMGPGMGLGRGLGPAGGPSGGPGAGVGMGEDMSTIHAMFANREKINRTIKILPNGAEALTESDDKKIAKLLQDHVPDMDGRVLGNDPLPPMRMHPVFIELIKNSDKYTLEYEDTEKGIKTKYQSDDPYVVMLVQEHAKLVSRFIENGMDELHKPYTLPKVDKAAALPAAGGP